MHSSRQVRLRVLASFGMVLALGIAPAQAIDSISDRTPVQVQNVTLKHTRNLLVTGIIGQAGDHSATVTWNAPAGDYANQVVAYKVVANYKNPATNKRESTDPVLVTNVAQRSATLTGLLNGVWHDFTITAQSNTEWSAVNTNNIKNGGMVKPSGLPCAATTVSTVPGNKRVTVRWNRPCNGGATVRFSVGTYKDSVLIYTKTNIADNRTAPLATITGLTNGASYSFTVTSTNINGSVVSAVSSVVSPRP